MIKLIIVIGIAAIVCIVTAIIEGIVFKKDKKSKFNDFIDNMHNM